jgi:hypothetical protein
MNVASFNASSISASPRLTCWSEIIKLGIHLQTHHDLTFPQVSTLLDLRNCPAIYDESNRDPIHDSVDPPCATTSETTSPIATISRRSAKSALRSSSNGRPSKSPAIVAFV